MLRVIEERIASIGDAELELRGRTGDGMRQRFLGRKARDRRLFTAGR